MHCNVELVYHSYLRLLHDTTDNTYMVGSSKDQNRGTITGQYHLNILSMLILVTKQSIKLGGSWDHPGYYFCRALCVSSRLCKCPSRVPWVLCHYQEVAVATQSWTGSYSLQNLAPCINQRPCVLWRKSELAVCTCWCRYQGICSLPDTCISQWTPHLTTIFH